MCFKQPFLCLLICLVFQIFFNLKTSNQNYIQMNRSIHNLWNNPFIFMHLGLESSLSLFIFVLKVRLWNNSLQISANVSHLYYATKNVCLLHESIKVCRLATCLFYRTVVWVLMNELMSHIRSLNGQFKLHNMNNKCMYVLYSCINE
jgi:hypothetical protein